MTEHLAGNYPPLPRSAPAAPAAPSCDSYTLPLAGYVPFAVSVLI